MSAYKLKISWKTSWSLSLILFILGLTAVVFSYARYVKQAVKQDIRMQVFVDSKTSTSELHTIFKSLNQLPQIDTVFSVSKEVAAKQLKHDLGEDVLAFLDENPLFHVFEIRLAENATESSILASLQRTISAWHGVSEVMFERDYIDRLNLNIKYLSYALFFLGSILIIIALNLISSTIQLSIVENSEDVRTMHLIGATRLYISKPFLRKSLLEGLCAWGLALAWLFATQYFLNRMFPFLESALPLTTILIIGFAILLLSVCMVGLSTLSAVFRFLSRKQG